MKRWLKEGLVVMGAVAAPAIVMGADAAAPAPATAASVEAVQNNLNIVWTLVAGILVFFMQAGFAMVETGFTRAKNASNIMMKNLMDFAAGTLAFYVLGFALMFGKSAGGGIIGTTGFCMQGWTGPADWNWTFMIFQTMFAATSATIVSGAVAERTKFSAYLIYSVLVSLVIYPISGKWAWGGLLGGDECKGWLELLSTGAFCDFAGSAVVHSVGGWLALAGAIVLGPRIGKYGPDGKAHAFPGHNLVIGALGVFILWVGWFGFNPGSTTIGEGGIGRIALTTNLGAAAGCVMAMITSWALFKKPDLSMSLNGALAGLVAITASCNTVTPSGAIAIGAIGGVLVVLSVLLLDHKLKIDDPVGAVSVHAVNGLWGTIACGLFNAEGVIKTAEKSTGLFYGGGVDQLISQLIGAGAYFAWAFGLGLIMFTIIKKTIGFRVSRDEELKGLDICEHGNEAYSGFQFFITQ